MHFLGGSIAGFLTCIVVQPLDVIKTRLQQDQHFGVKVEEAVRKRSQVSLFAIPRTGLAIIKHEGPVGLWRGTGPTIMRTVPGSGLYFLTLDTIRRFIRQTSRSLSSSTVNLLAGGLSRASVGFLMMPLSVLKTRFESSFYNYKSIGCAFRDVYAERGIRGLFYGAGATAMRDAPFAGLYVMFYEKCKPVVGGFVISPKNEPLVNMISGVASAMAATYITQPFDMLKTRMQLKPDEYRNTWRAALKVAAEEGVFGFFTGIIPRVVRKSLSSAISWTIYEEFVKWSDQPKNYVHV